LIPGVKGLSENIRVISLVDRFLEHSRIYYFAQANQMYLSSADWMPRNFFSRLELAFPVLSPRLFHFIRDVVIPVYLADTVKGRELTPQGTWRKRSPSDTNAARLRRTPSPFQNLPVRAQFHFEELARNAYHGTPLSRPAPSQGPP
jgi:polyphosphate kinase